MLGLSLSTMHPLLIGVLLGCSISIVLYNLLRFIYTRYHSNLLLSFCLSFFVVICIFSKQQPRTYSRFEPQVEQ